MHFVLPAGAAQLLRKIPGFQTYDERVHCLKALIPATGTADAPRAFNLKFSKCLHDFGYRPSKQDPELEILYKNGELQAVLAKHVDDANMGAGYAATEATKKAVENVFGKLAWKQKKFDSVGIGYEQTRKGDVILNQDEYIQQLTPITGPTLYGKGPDEECDEALQTQFMSLLGAVAYSLLTQHWLSVYVVALQRKSKQASCIHVRRLNAVVRAVQRKPQKVVLQAMRCQSEVEGHSDSAFAREQDKGYGMKGMNILRRGLNAQGETIFHLLIGGSQSHKHVTRTVFSSELLALNSTAEESLSVATTLAELKDGPFNP